MSEEGRAPARLVSLEELQTTWGHGWEELPEVDEVGRLTGTSMLEECVWIYGHVAMSKSGYSDMFQKCWDKLYGVKGWARFWDGSVPPTAEQMAETPWRDPEE